MVTGRCFESEKKHSFLSEKCLDVVWSGHCCGVELSVGSACSMLSGSLSELYSVL